MCKHSSKFLVPITTVNLLISIVLPQFCLAQSKVLPRSQFSNYMNQGSLPSGSGLRLQEGADRPAGAPAEVYNPGEPKLGHKLVRWEPRHMPLRVWISPGKKMPEEPISVINAQRPNEVLNLLMQDPAQLLKLPQCQGWSPEMNTAAKEGIEQWREFQNEGLLSFEFVDDPALATVFLFWAERFSGDEGVGGVSTGGNTVAVLYDANDVRSKEASLGRALQNMPPVVIELQTRSDSFEQLQARAAHEFGHALGIKEHSPYNQDLMCVNGIAKYLSASDKATIRWLYRQKTPYLMMPANLQKVSSQIVQTQQSGQTGQDLGAWADGTGSAGGAQQAPAPKNRGAYKIGSGSGGDGDAEIKPGGAAPGSESENGPAGSAGAAYRVRQREGDQKGSQMQQYESPFASGAGKEFASIIQGAGKIDKKSRDKEETKKDKKNKNERKDKKAKDQELAPGNSETSIPETPSSRASDGF